MIFIAAEAIFLLFKTIRNYLVKIIIKRQVGPGQLLLMKRNKRKVILYPGRLVLADLSFQGCHIYYFLFQDAYKYKGKAPHLPIHSFIITSSLLGAEGRFRPSYCRFQNFGPPWKFSYFGIFALLGFTLGIRVSGISSWYFLLGLRV